METFIDRLRIELHELKTKVEKLENFLQAVPTFVTSHQINLLVLQLASMQLYCNVLRLRLEDLEKQDPTHTPL